MAEIRVPASTSNLGPGFDCFGLALKLYLTVGATSVPEATEPCRVTTTGAKENEVLPRNAANLIYRAMVFAARREGVSLSPVELQVHNEIPLASGLGSSAAAVGVQVHNENPPPGWAGQQCGGDCGGHQTADFIDRTRDRGSVDSGLRDR